MSTQQQEPNSDEEPEHPMDLMTLEQADQHVEQYRRQLKMNREKVSVVVEQIKNACQQAMAGDPLLKKMSSKVNPYVEETNCTVL